MNYYEIAMYSDIQTEVNTTWRIPYDNQQLNKYLHMKTSEIKFTVKVDENNLPISIDWDASDAAEKSKCKSVMIALWDAKEENTLRIDLWTKDMMVDDMKKFFHQSLLSMADTFKRATGEEKITEDLKDYCQHFAEKMGIMNPTK